MKITIYTIPTLRIITTKIKKLLFNLTKPFLLKSLTFDDKKFIKELSNFSNIYLIDIKIFLIIYIKLITNAKTTVLYTNEIIYQKNYNFLKFLKIKNSLIKNNIYLPKEFREYSSIVPELIIRSKECKVSTNIELIKEIKLN